MAVFAKKQTSFPSLTNDCSTRRNCSLHCQSVEERAVANLLARSPAMGFPAMGRTLISLLPSLWGETHTNTFADVAATASMNASFIVKWRVHFSAETRAGRSGRFLARPVTFSPHLGGVEK